jgi:methyl-accepting chemotaxis protein
MSSAWIFVLVIFFFVLPLAFLSYRLKYKGTIVYKTAFSNLVSNMVIALGAYFVGYLGILHVIWFVILGYTALFIGNIAVKRYIQKPANFTTQVLNKVSYGDLDVQIDEELKKSDDEIGQMNTALADMVEYLKETGEFARQVGEGNFDYNIEALSDKDHLRHVLLEMRDKLKEASELEAEKRKEEEQRRWANEGMTKLNDILRQQDDITELSYNVISFLVQYLKANQGGIFIRNNDDENEVFFELQAAYAFNRRKYIDKTFKPGEGLVGTCAIEKERIYMTNIPDDYIEITSGLGGSNPKALLIVPMKIEEEVYGVIEIASFNSFENYQIEFVEEASLSIASTLSAVETNRKTKELLEKTQQQAEEMSSQEEEMRQNMEELQATQEESTRKAQEYERQLAEANEKQEELEKKLEEANKEIERLKKKKG